MPMWIQTCKTFTGGKISVKNKGEKKVAEGVGIERNDKLILE